MLFLQGVFAPELIADHRARSVLAAAADQAAEPVRPGDFLAAALRLRDPRVLALLSQALSPAGRPKG